ncbi:MAG: hypothetical protein WD733_16650 [Bryobacterales bacterium]
MNRIPSSDLTGAATAILDRDEQPVSPGAHFAYEQAEAVALLVRRTAKRKGPQLAQVS